MPKNKKKLSLLRWLLKSRLKMSIGTMTETKICRRKLRDSSKKRRKSKLL